jgi:serine/threonine protein kinase
MNMHSSLQAGAVAGRYRLGHVLGRGGMGEVWAATHVSTGRRVALKFLRSTAQLHSHARRRFLREARAATAVRHPNVVQVHDLFELDDGTPVMVMDLLEGETFGERLKREIKLTLPETLSILMPVASAVSAAHELGIVHRDLKPDNVFLVRGSNGSTEVRVLDFGIAKLTSAEFETHEATATGALLGTPCYMSPEQSFGESDVDRRADVWAIGVMFYEALSGALPVVGDNLGQFVKRLVTDAITPLQYLVPDLPPAIHSLVDRMLSRDREKRPSDLGEVMATLAPFATADALSSVSGVSVGSDPTSPPVSIAQPPPLRSSIPRPRATRPALVALFATLLVGLVIFPIAVRKRRTMAPPRQHASPSASIGLGAGERSTDPVGDRKLYDKSQFVLERSRMMPLMHGTEGDLPKLLQNVAAHPADLDAHLMLLGYRTRHWKSEDLERRDETLRREAIWFLSYYPDHPATEFFVEMFLFPPLEPEIVRIWDRWLHKEPENTVLLSNAARFFMMSDPARARTYKLRLRELEPTNPQWMADSAHEHYVSSSDESLSIDARAAEARLSLQEYEQAVRLSGGKELMVLVNAGDAALAANELQKATNFAKELIGADRNAHASYVHKGHILLGKIALAKKQVARARAELMLAARVPADRVLKTFGPETSLAEALLEGGDRATVIAYLIACKRLWTTETSILDEWVSQLRHGDTPKFQMRNQVPAATVPTR